MSDFLPADYTVPKAGGNYMKFSQGANAFRILSKPIMGIEYWKTVVGEDGKEQRKPVRLRPGQSVEVSELDDKPPKHFWAMVVWNYNESQIQILEITQRSILEYITTLARNPKWGSPLEYDIVVTREGEGMETRYTTIADPKEPVAKEIKEAFENTKINLEALYDGGDPFAEKSQEIDINDIKF